MIRFSRMRSSGSSNHEQARSKTTRLIDFSKNFMLDFVLFDFIRTFYRNIVPCSVVPGNLGQVSSLVRIH